MNKKYRINSGILFVFILVLSFFAACKGGKKAPEEEIKVPLPEDNAAILQDIKQAEKIFKRGG